MIKRLLSIFLLSISILFLAGCSPIEELYVAGNNRGGYFRKDNGYLCSEKREIDSDVIVVTSLKSIKDSLFVADVSITNLTSETISVQIRQSFFLADKLMLLAKRSSIITLDRKTATALFGEYASKTAEQIQTIASTTPKYYEVRQYGTISTISPSSWEELGKSIAILGASSEMTAVRDLQKDIFINGLDDIEISPKCELSGKVCFIVGYSLKIDYPIYLFINVKNSSFKIGFKKFQSS